MRACTSNVRMMDTISKYIDEIMVYTRSHKDIMDIDTELNTNNKYSFINMRLEFISDALLCTYLDIPDWYFTKVNELLTESISNEKHPVVSGVLKILKDRFDIIINTKDNVNKKRSWWHFLFG